MTRPRPARHFVALGAALALGTMSAPCQAEPLTPATQIMTDVQTASAALSARQQAIVPIAASSAAGDTSRLQVAIDQGLDSGLTVSDIREVLVQLYAYAGFPRSLNALGELMNAVAARRERGIHDAMGEAPSRPVPVGDALLAAGTANQTQLSGGPVTGPLFEFAPAIDQYLKAHLFGAIFERDNLDWQSREVATVSMLSALEGVESQLQSHVRIGMNVGLTANQLGQLADELQTRVCNEAAARVREAVARQMSAAGAGGRPSSP